MPAHDVAVINSTSSADVQTTNSQLSGIKNSMITGNIQGLFPRSKQYKPRRIGELAIENDALIISLTESHLDNCILDAEIKIDGFTIFRQDRESAPKGGIITYIRDSFASTARTVASGSTGQIEFLCIYIEDKKLLLITIYRPPTENQMHFSEVLKTIDDCINSLNDFPSIILTGDFNYPRICWMNGQAVNLSVETNRNSLINFADKHFLTQYIDQPTREQNILDLLFTNNADIFSKIDVPKTPELSDHNLIIANTSLPKAREHSSSVDTGQNSFRSLNFFHKDINWENINQEIEAIDWQARFNNNGVQDNFDTFRTELLKIAFKYVPKRKAYRKKKRYIPRDRKKLMQKRRTLSGKIASSRNPSLIARHVESIKDIERRLKTSFDNERKQEENRAIQCMRGEDKNYFYKFAKSKAKIKSKIGPFEREGQIIEDPKLKAEILKEQFESVYSTPGEEQMEISPPLVPEVTLQEFEITEANIEAQIKELRKKAAAGPDDIPAVLLKNCINSVKYPLSIFWNQSLQDGNIPEILKTGIITPIYKGKDRNQPVNYRPVSLTSNIIKIFEKLIKKKIVEHMETNGHFNSNQHGFRTGRSCISQLLNHHTKIIEALELGKKVDVIYLDFAKAFDKVHHGILLQKLKKVGITGKLHRWIGEFLRERKQYVAVEGALSSESEVRSGVPQGSVLGPLLFLIHIGDIDKQIRNSTVTCFADDTRIMKTIREDNDNTLLQEDLDHIYEWATTNKMKFNDRKFETINYQPGHRNEAYHNYTTESGSLIERKTEIRDLGIIMNNEASFAEHITAIAKKGKNLAGWALRTFQSRETNLMLTLLKVLIRPHLEYGCQVWNPHKACEIKLLESVQRSFTRKIDGTTVGTVKMNYWERLQHLKLYSLQRRRERYIIIYVWKIVYGHVPNLQPPITAYLSDRQGLTCRRRDLTHGRYTRFGTLKENSLVGKGLLLFNRLPAEIKACNDSLETFKKKLDNFLKTVPDQPVMQGYHQPASDNSITSQLEALRTRNNL